MIDDVSTVPIRFAQILSMKNGTLDVSDSFNFGLISGPAQQIGSKNG